MLKPDCALPFAIQAVGLPLPLAGGKKKRRLTIAASYIMY